MTAPIQKRRVMSSSSGFGWSVGARVLASSAIPHVGQLPGATRTTSGCIGQVYSTVGSNASAPSSASSAIPHFGQAPGSGSRTSGSIGHVNQVPEAGLPADALAEAEGAASGAEDWGVRNRSGSAWNFARQPSQQK